MTKGIALIFILILLTSCCKEENLDKNVIWSKNICGNQLIEYDGIGYPVYDHTVVFHSTPLPINNHYQTILYGLDTETGAEKWRLTNKDFFPKQNLQFSNSGCRYYQNKNIVIACDYVTNVEEERYIYAIDINAGKVLWIKELPQGYNEIGRLVRGEDKYAYIDATNSTTSHFSLLKIDIETGEYTSSLDLTNNELSTSITDRGTVISVSEFSDIYQNKDGDDLIALSINSLEKLRRDRWFMTLYVYNLTKKEKVYSVPVACEDSLLDTFFGRIFYHNGKIIVGKGAEVLCYDAFENKEAYWQHFIGRDGNDNMMQVLAHDDVALAFAIDTLYGYNINTGQKLYSVPAPGGDIASILDGIIYQRYKSDLGMRDPNTGTLLRRVATAKNEQAFSNARINGHDGKIFVHSYTHAFCIKAWGK